MKNNLKSLRVARGWSLQKFGDMCGRSNPHMQQLERQDSNPTLNTAYAIAKVLDVDVTDIWPNDFEVVEEIVTVRWIKTKDQK